MMSFSKGQVHLWNGFPKPEWPVLLKEVKKHSEAVLTVPCSSVSEPSEDLSYIQATLSSEKILWWVAKHSLRDLYFVSWWYFSLGNFSWRNMENVQNFTSRKENWLTPLTNFVKIFNECHNQIFKQLIILSLLMKLVHTSYFDKEKWSYIYDE